MFKSKHFIVPIGNISKTQQTTHYFSQSFTHSEELKTLSINFTDKNDSGKWTKQQVYPNLRVKQWSNCSHLVASVFSHFLSATLFSSVVFGAAAPLGPHLWQFSKIHSKELSDLVEELRLPLCVPLGCASSTHRHKKKEKMYTFTPLGYFSCHKTRDLMSLYLEEYL
ncbi:hypothetical protein CEXT_447221 [Caerostris extrusa]|uniref:Uncharacterized protein n=1 Tax=Caerostris extrusa TaxID=172846 RepID=A0AAV4NTB8_CAEEX|nr:hypothetical protein CEXT_447221 [Caerostris extrusa]